MYYLAFALAMIPFVLAFLDAGFRGAIAAVGAERFESLGTAPVVAWEAGVAAVAVFIYWGVIFGLVSRRFEAEADVFGARLTRDPQSFAEALAKIARANGVRVNAPGWRHGSIASRVERIKAVVRDPAEARSFTRSTEAMKGALLVLYAAAVVYYLAAW
jgi:STE24 endopeptidase